VTTAEMLDPEKTCQNGAFFNFIVSLVRNNTIPMGAGAASQGYQLVNG